MSDLDSFLARIGVYLKTRGMRRTQQRVLIAGLVYSIESPFTADALVEYAKLLGPDKRISRTIIYRTLNEFVDAGVVRQQSSNVEHTQYHRIDWRTDDEAVEA